MYIIKSLMFIVCLTLKPPVIHSLFWYLRGSCISSLAFTLALCLSSKCIERYSGIMFMLKVNEITNMNTILTGYMWCDLKQNESELEYNENPVFNCNICPILRAIFWWNPHQNWTFGSRDISILVLLKTIKYKGNWKLLLIVS